METRSRNGDGTMPHCVSKTHSSEGPGLQKEAPLFKRKSDWKETQQGSEMRSLECIGNHSVCTVSSILVCQPQSALSMLHWQRQQRRKRKIYLVQGVPAENQSSFTLFHGITELAGEAGTGKTQICLDYCVSLAVKQKRALYLSLGTSNMSPRHIRMERVMTQRINSRKDQCRHGQQHTRGCSATSALSQVHDVKELMNNIITKSIMNVDQFHSLLGIAASLQTRINQKNQSLKKISAIGELEELLIHMMEQNTPVKVIVIDSISTLFRTPDTHNNSTIGQAVHGVSTVDPSFIMKRAQTFFQASAILKRLSDQFQVPVIMVNEVTSNMSDLNGRSNSSTAASRASSRPSLGLAWSCCINQRYMLTRREEFVLSMPTLPAGNVTTNATYPLQRNATKFRRHIRITQSPQVTCGDRKSISEFYIDGAGVHYKIPERPS
jgi:hypothetical protein